MSAIEWIVLYGGVSSERPVSLVSGAAVVAALGKHRKVRGIDVRRRALPTDIVPGKHLVFPVFHGEFGEDGKVQALLEEKGIEFAGCGSAVSALCMHKQRTKDVVSAAGIPVPQGVEFDWSGQPSVESLLAVSGPQWLLKPVDQGSSVGLLTGTGAELLSLALASSEQGRWLCEQRVAGKDITVGVLDGKAMGVVMIEPDGGLYDFHHKYTSGKTRYLAPAPLPAAVYGRARQMAETVWNACGCRDFARIDFLVDTDGRITFLEVNTIPGLTPTSLLPKSAACQQLDFEQLLLRMIAPAEQRFHCNQATPYELA